jgi:hypothetical protein
MAERRYADRSSWRGGGVRHTVFAHSNSLGGATPEPLLLDIRYAGSFSMAIIKEIGKEKGEIEVEYDEVGGPCSRCCKTIAQSSLFESLVLVVVFGGGWVWEVEGDIHCRQSVQDPSKAA